MQSLIHRRRGLHVLAFCTFFLIGIGALVYYAQGYVLDAPKSVAFNQQFSSFIVPDIAIGSTTYSVSHGVVTTGGKAVTNPNIVSLVLRIAYFTIANRLDPIMALGGTDPQKLASAVAALKQSTHSFSAAYPKNIRALLAGSFYPINFLETLPQLEASRRTLLAHPSYQNALQYNSSLHSALTQYQSGIEKTTSALNELSSENAANNEYAFPGGYTTSSVVDARLSFLAASAADDEQKAEARFNCLNGNSASCPPLQDLLPLTGSSSEFSVIPDVLPSPLTRVESLLTSMEKTNATALGEQFNGLDVVALTKSDCLSTTSPFYVYAWTIRDARSSVSDFRFESINTMYFFDLRKKTQSAFYTDLRKQGLSFLVQRMSNFYECPDSGIESARVASLYELAHRVTLHPLFFGKAFPKQNSLMQRASVEEGQMASSSFISEEAIAQYINTLSTLL